MWKLKPTDTAEHTGLSHNTRVVVRVQILPHGQGLALPEYQTKHAAGMDLLAALAPDETITMEPGQRAIVPTGLIFEIPEGFEAQIRPRSGLALKHGVTVLNSPGTIDADYRGEIKVLLINLGTEAFIIERNTRLAQVVFAPIIQVSLQTALELSESERGAGGFGSTGY